MFVLKCALYRPALKCWQPLYSYVRARLSLPSVRRQTTTATRWTWTWRWRSRPAKPRCSAATSPKCSSAHGTPSATCWPRGEWPRTPTALALACCFGSRLPSLTSPLCRTQLGRLHRQDLEPEREQQLQLHPACAAPLHTRRRTGRPEQQRRHLAGLECRCLVQGA